MGLSQQKNDLFQVITSHPHDLKELKPYIKTVYESGRLWVVELNEDAPDSVRPYLRMLTGRENTYYVLRTQTPEDKTSPAVKKVISDAKKENIKKDVIKLSSYKNRAAGTRENQEAMKETAKRFLDMGFTIKEYCYKKDVCSFVADKVGSVKASEVIMTMGHLDSVGRDFAGADDNASGVAVMLEMARVLQTYKNTKTIRFFVTNGEELGLLGANHYAKALRTEGKLKELALVINMDMVGYNSNGIVELETNSQFEELANWYAELVNKYTSLKSKITLGAWGSDHVPFLEQDVPAILTIEDWSTKTPCYHRACDLPDTLNYNYALEITKLNTAAVMSKDLE